MEVNTRTKKYKNQLKSIIEFRGHNTTRIISNTDWKGRPKPICIGDVPHYEVLSYYYINKDDQNFERRLLQKIELKDIQLIEREDKLDQLFQ